MTQESLPKNIVIRHRDDFEQLFQSGKRVPGTFVYLLYLPMLSDEPQRPNVGFVCGKKIGNAVTRNKYKRLMREIFRKHKGLFTGFQVLIVAQSAILNADSRSLQEEILSLTKALSK